MFVKNKEKSKDGYMATSPMANHERHLEERMN